MKSEKYMLLEASLSALKSLRHRMLEFEDVLSFCLDEDGDGGLEITEAERELLEIKLGDMVNQAERTKLMLKNSIRAYKEGVLNVR